MLKRTELPGINAWYGVRFAELTAGRRFTPPRPAEGQLLASRLAEVPVFPQLPSRLASAMGHGVALNDQSDEAFFLNVWAPTDGDALPVLFFIHGGAWMSGGGSMEWYDGAAMARQGIVVVTVNYRIGPVAHLADPSAAGLPLPAEDLICALHWVNEHISGLGGDPQKVTVVGQSAGAWYGHLLSTVEEGAGLFRTAAHLSMGTRTPWDQQRFTEVRNRVKALLGGRDLQDAPAAELLRAGSAGLGNETRPLGYAGSAFLPTMTARLPAGLMDPKWSARNCHVESVYLRNTADESATFLFNSPPEVNATWPQVDEILQSLDPDHIPPGFNTSALSPYRALVAISSWRQFQRFPAELLQTYEQAGIGVQYSDFSLESPLEGLHSGHCLDLPFQFGNRSAWADAPMLAGITDDEFATISQELIDDLTNFVMT
ncbi:carboxylesterase family protein [Arthrobacter sp. M4]|uniref:carboxylesterase family protein n=1 Tax=Arthrobacter sp. M4 TaxID=218160 RepID=UPI001CDC518C|nr:carboxylesterase family protein [Arthrobacter sp. M4]MCA4132492.1 carboxylesterase family protein [Arthrobacter sp. M4]